MKQQTLPLPLRAMRRRISPADFQRMVLREIERRNLLRAAADRSGMCVCGREVALHFDERNRKIACEDLR